MDNGDIFIGVVRAVMDICSAYVNVPIYVLIMASFSYFRLYVYWRDILPTSFFDVKAFHHNSALIHQTLCALLFVLLILNVYWFVLLIKMIIRYKKVGAPLDLQHNMIKKKVQN
jgi:hypothetical protein